MKRAILVLLCLAALCIAVQSNGATVAVFSGQETFASAVSGRLSSLGFDSTAWTSASVVTPENLNGVDALMVLTGYSFLLEGQWEVIENYVAAGGALIIEQPNVAGPVYILPPGLGIDVYGRAYSDMGTAITTEGLVHPITAGLSAEDICANMETVYVQDISPDYVVLAVGRTDPTLVALAAASYGSGKVIFNTGNMHPASLQPSSDEFVRRLVAWAVTPESPMELVVQVLVSPKKINLKSRGYVHAAVLSDWDFDAGRVDPGSVLVAGATPDRWALEDVNGDGLADMVFFAGIQSLELNGGETQIELTGCTIDGIAIRGVSSVTVTPSKKSGR